MAETKNKQILESNFMILPDGTLYAHNLTPVLAEILAGLNPDDAAMRMRREATVADRQSHGRSAGEGRAA